MEVSTMAMFLGLGIVVVGVRFRDKRIVFAGALLVVLFGFVGAVDA